MHAFSNFPAVLADSLFALETVFANISQLVLQQERS